TVSTAWDDAEALATITVADNGVGIAEEDIGSIFQVFASTKGARGTGLGLPVSQKIIREHGGKIVVTSKVGKGSQFVIELPMKRSDPNPRPDSGEGVMTYPG
ncbi:MAG: HAMP domain-containing histidine kinase, partial [Planctomycetaceae bacterium]|nr:HAMP domain-containing histidine kinase [Planctomycetaceae bacterium]